MKRFAIATLGCKVNVYESESYVVSLKKRGYTQVDFKETADVYIVNTCSVTNQASAKSRSKFRQAKKRNPDAVFCLVGCYIQTSIDKELLDVDVLVGSSNKANLAQYIEEARADKKKIHVVDKKRQESVFESLEVDHYEHKTRAFLKIQDGCNQFCTYCIIPYARGAERSLAKEEVLRQAKLLVQDKHREIVLTGIHIGRYGYDLGYTLSDLLKELLEIKQLKRIRISSIEVNEVSDELINLMASNLKIARHLHIPIQSGSDDILKSMNRPYTLQRFQQKINEIRNKLPNISISSDLIVGFPNEDEVQMQETMETLKQLDFSFVHIFPFSKRDGTRAELLVKNAPIITNDEKHRRIKRMQEAIQPMQAKHLESFLHQEGIVLVEGEKNGYYKGFNSQYQEVYLLKSQQDLYNQFVKVRYEQCKSNILIAQQEDMYEIIEDY